MVKVRDGQVANRARLRGGPGHPDRVTLAGEKDGLGLRAGRGGEGERQPDAGRDDQAKRTLAKAQCLAQGAGIGHLNYMAPFALAAEFALRESR